MEDKLIFLYFIPRTNNAMFEVESMVYVVQWKNDIPLILVKEQHKDYIMSKTCDCNCGNGVKKPCARLASKEEIDLWMKE
jgi:hypothetical protein